ncbi:arylesterase [Zavarzinia sp. CC-PAN008]|uniref:arylesterase n=1 Tax=Zavarzinia sp. CC-PAN008 TaxID=3243332 RepID=UPI003F74A20F
MPSLTAWGRNADQTRLWALWRYIALFLAFNVAAAIGPDSAAHAQASSAQAAPAQVRVLALGDSLTAGYGLDPEQGFTVRLAEALKARGIDARVENAGVSGDTSAGGLARLDWALGAFNGATPDLVIVELGANDALRGLDPQATRENLRTILQRLKEKGAPVLLAGMMAPPNLGPDYGQAFNTIYSDLATEFDVALYPFFLDGVAAEAALNQADGIHPNAQGVDEIVKRITPHVAAALADGTQATK